MNFIKIDFDNKAVLIFDAPENATHSNFQIDDLDMIQYNLCRKNKILEFEKIEKPLGLRHLVNVGAMATADESLVADLFIPVKNGNFYDYEYNGVFYPNAKSAFEDMIAERCTFKNPYVLVLYNFKS